MQNEFTLDEIENNINLITHSADFLFGMDDIHRFRKELYCLMKKFQGHSLKYKSINCDSKLELRLNFDKEIKYRKHGNLWIVQD